MTQDFKQNLFQWLIGTYSTENNPEDFNTFVGGWNTYIQEVFDELGTDTEILNGVQITSPNGNNSTWLVLLLWNSTTKKGGFLLLDENLEEQALITKYTSNVDIGRYDNLYLDENGRIYGIECVPSEERYRFVMLSNFLVKIGNEYKCDIRRTYNIPNGWSLVGGYETITTYIKKIPNVPKYAIFIKENQYYGGMIATLEISVEEGNTWKTSYIPSFYNKFLRPYIIYNNNNIFTFYTIEVETMTVTRGANLYIFQELTEQQSDNWFSFNAKRITTVGEYFLPAKVDCYYISNSEILIPMIDTNFSKFYFKKITLIDDGGGNYIGEDEIIWEEDAYTNNTQVIFAESNGYLFCYASTMNIQEPGAEYNIGYKEMVYHISNKTSSITDDDIHEHIIQEETGSSIPTQWGANFFVVQNIYNLYNYITGLKFYNTYLNKFVCSLDVVNEVYNENNYNGTPYKALNSLIGKQGFLYDENEHLIFARNLYNKVIQSNKTTYSIEVPNNMLNDMGIKIQKLLSETKQTMNSHEEIITTNQYEELIINFINYITIVNENDENNPIYNRIGASRLNSSISRDKDYNDAKMTKYRVNYIDNTSVVGDLQITSQGTSANLKVRFKVKPTTAVRNIEFISNDEQSVYNTITPTLEVDKSYEITQTVHIE